MGVLGAIDPSRVQPELPRPSPFNYDAQHFLVTLVQEHLVRVLQTASDISQLETTSYALQQVLQHFTANRLRVTSAVVQVSVHWHTTEPGAGFTISQGLHWLADGFHRHGGSNGK